MSTLLYRRVTEADYPLILAWRSNPLTYDWFWKQSQPPTWEEHVIWWDTRNDDWVSFMVDLHENAVTRPIGLLTIGQLDSWQPDIGLYIGEVTLRDKGYGKNILEYAIEWLQYCGYEHARATVLDKNKRSIKLFEKHGFERVSSARKGESLYAKRV